MNIEAYINITIQVFAGLISLMIILSICVYQKKLSLLNKLYIRFLMCNIFLQLFNVLSWLVDIGYIYGQLAFVIHFMMYLFSYLLIGCFAHYFLSYMSQKNIFTKYTKKIVLLLIMISIGILIISQFQGWYYSVDASYHYHRGEFYWLSNVMGVLCLLPMFILLVNNYKKLNKKESIVFLGYFLLPIGSVFSMMMRYGDIYIHIITIIVISSIYFFIQTEESKQQMERELELERRKTQLMVSQIQPHFLFNVLTGIMQLSESDMEKVYPALEHLSYYLRGNINALSRIELIPFKTELNQLESYLYLEYMRFPNKFRVIYELKEKEFLLPTLLLQPLVENAIHHGIKKKEELGSIIIRTHRLKNTIRIDIIDDGIGFNPYEKKEDGKTHIGIENVKTRLLLMCNGTLEIVSHKDVGTTITILIPIKEGA